MLSVTIKHNCPQQPCSFGSGDFYKKTVAKTKINGLKIKPNLDIPFSELSEYFAKKRKRVLENINICPYGFIPEEWDIDMLENPIKLILDKIANYNIQYIFFV